MATESLPSNSDVTDDTYEPPTRHQQSEDMSPHLAELVQEFLVVLNMAKLGRVVVILLQVPIWGRRDYKMHRFICEKGEVTRISIDQPVRCLDHITSPVSSSVPKQSPGKPLHRKIRSRGNKTPIKTGATLGGYEC